MLKDINLTCRQCGRQFVFTRGEQEFFSQKGLTPPGRCPECRSVKQSQPHNLVCSQCGAKLEKGASLYCTACLASVHLESELRTKQTQKEADEAQSKLLVTESEKAELRESLRQQEQLMAELKLKFNDLSKDLDKVHQFQASLEWPQQALNGLEEKLNTIEKRLEALEHAHNKINQRMLQMVQRMHEIYESTSLWKAIKRSLLNTFTAQKAQREKNT